jgi:hypothetical protein
LLLTYLLLLLLRLLLLTCLLLLLLRLLLLLLLLLPLLCRALAHLSHCRSLPGRQCHRANGLATLLC